MRYKAIIVDDERLARVELRSMLEEYPQVHVVGEADGVHPAAALVHTVAPDVVFLDVQMPGLSGFELFEHVDATFKTIFVTAYDAHALRAFEVNALDYLLKPVSPRRLASAIERLGADGREPEPQPRRLDYGDRLFLTADDRPRLLKVETIVSIRAADDYSQVQTCDGKTVLVQKPLKEWEERLPDNCFWRIHRSTIVNVEYVERIEENLNRSYLVYLRGVAEPFLVSRRYATELRSRFG
jgi:two-component system, LytTR family, response regulator